MINEITLSKIISVIHNVRFGGLPTHYPSITSWDSNFLSDKIIINAWKIFLKKHPEKETGIYLNIPFCKVKCGFCFLDVKGSASETDYLNYSNSVEKEIKRLSPVFKQKIIKSVYIGGGTPNILPSKYLRHIINALKNNFNIDKEAQISMEANPDFFDKEKCEVIHDCGVNLVMLGIQSFSKKINEANGRSQNVLKIKNAFKLLRESGIKHINSDLLCGLNSQSKKDFIKDVKILAGLRPTQIHLNRIKPLRGTLPADIKKELMTWQKEGLEILKENGYQILDEESACLKGIRNIQGNYIFHVDNSLLGIGSGSLSHIWGELRYQNITTPSLYVNNILSDKPAAWRNIPIDYEDEIIHYLMNTLLHGVTVSEKNIEDKFGGKGKKFFVKKAKQMEKTGYLERSEKGWHCSLNMRDWLGITAALYSKKYLSKIAGKYSL